MIIVIIRNEENFLVKIGNGVNFYNDLKCKISKTILLF